MCGIRFGLIGILLLGLAIQAQGQSAKPQAAEVPGPPPPEKYQATIRYRILTLRDTHVAQYDGLIAHLQKLKFEFKPPLEEHPETDREDRTKDQLSGLVPSANALKILKNPYVASVLLVPQDFKLPDEPDKQVHVRLELAPELSALAQFNLMQQVRLQLGLLGFRAVPGYDQRGYSGKPFTRIVGVLPMSQLSLPLRDLRLMPTNWFDLQVPVRELPMPLRSVNPILVTEVLPDPEPLRELPIAEERNPPSRERLSPDLWAMLQQKDEQQTIIRVQLILIGSPDPKDRELRFTLLQAAPSLIIDGFLGPVITGSVMVEHLAKLSAIPQISAIRRAQVRTAQVDPKIKASGDKAKALALSGLAGLHRAGFRGKGVRLAIIDTDFRGWDRLVAENKLPKNTIYVDLASVPDDPLRSIPVPGDPEQVGHGSHCALAANLAAPEAELVLLRIEGAAPAQMVEVGQYFQGGYLPDSVSRRRDDLLVQRRLLRLRREELLKVRPEVLKGFEDERELELNYGFMGPVMGWIFSERQLHYQHIKYQEKLGQELSRQYDRFFKHVDTLEKLKGIKLVVSSHNWQDGYPVGGASALSRWLHVQKKLLWFQSAGNTRGQAWTGFFRDADRNGIMEFSDPQTPLKKGRWTRELNFLGWRPYEGKLTDDLPAGARVRISMQWREPHDRDYYFRPDEDDYYLRPLTDMKLQAFRQRDPDMKLLPADSFEVAGRTGRLPVRLVHQPGYSIYEHSAAFTVDKPGHYAVQIERRLPSLWIQRLDPRDNLPRFELLTDLVPTGMRPLGAPTLAQLESNWELHLRLFVEVLDENNRLVGRVVFRDHVTEEGSMGLPADSLGAITVGAVDLEGKSFVASALGPPAFQQQNGKQPDLWAYAGLNLLPEGSNPALGSSLAAPFAAGWAASILSTRASQEQLTEFMRHQAGKIVRAPVVR